MLTPADLQPGVSLVGWVTQVSPECLWLDVAPGIRGRVHALEVSDSPEQLQQFPEPYTVGQAVVARVLEVDQKQHVLNLTMKSEQGLSGDAGVKGSAAKAAVGGQGLGGAGGVLVTGKVMDVRGEGVVVQIGPRQQGVVALTDIHDFWVPNALAGISKGTFVKARVLDDTAAGSGQGSRVALSLRHSDGGHIQGFTHPEPVKTSAGQPSPAPKGLLAESGDLKEGANVAGYVRGVSAKGLFVSLDRQQVARVKLSQMSDGFVEDPAAAFPPGTRVEGRVMSVGMVEGGKEGEGAAAAAAAVVIAGSSGGGGSSSRGGLKVEMTLRSGKGGWRQLSDIKEGEITTGKVSCGKGEGGAVMKCFSWKETPYVDCFYVVAIG